MNFCCFSCRLWSHRSRNSFVTQGWIFFLSLLRNASAVESGTSFRLFARVSLHRCSGRRGLQTFHLPKPGTLTLFSGLWVSPGQIGWENLREMLGFELQLGGCNHEIMIAANVGTWERPCVCFVDAGLEALWCQDEVSLVVNLPTRGTHGCCPRQLVGVGRLATVSRWLFANSESTSSVIFVSPMPNLPTVPAQGWYALWPTLASQSRWTTSISKLSLNTLKGHDKNTAKEQHAGSVEARISNDRTPHCKTPGRGR